ncbi:MAG: hypothetical protein K2M54_10730, partial [Muribaculaceae bacterium]|nr:hypothetical protein [Muribaculaceae bacterium]
MIKTQKQSRPTAVWSRETTNKEFSRQRSRASRNIYISTYPCGLASLHHTLLTYDPPRGSIFK